MAEAHNPIVPSLKSDTILIQLIKKQAFACHVKWGWVERERDRARTRARESERK
jgi:hypothetical protein